MASVGSRPDPDALLLQAEAEETDTKKGRLKIFLGYASGVGKSVKMLDEGRRRRERGQDVVIGALQTPLSDELKPIVDKLPVIPLLNVNGIEAIDLNCLLQLRPAVCLIDGLAYDNPPGSRNSQRWQDVLELIDNGISVIGSINIQFIDELRPQVEGITGKRFPESVPRRFLSLADEIVVVDAPAETCFEKSKQAGVSGKVVGQKLSELREIALLLAAEVVDHQLETYLRRNGLASVFGAQERILLCLSPKSDASELIASGQRNAERFHCDLLAMYVENGRLSGEEQAQIEANLAAARAAGAAIHIVKEDDAADAILEFARARCITQIFVGQSAKKHWWERIGGSSLDRLIREGDGFDVRVFPQ